MAIRTLLVANRGEIAVRVLRTAHTMGIATVSVHSDPDADAPHVRLADTAVRLPGATPTETYLRGDLLIDAARATGADAVHPGYGFLSENAGFARACTAAGLVFVGPSPGTIAAMGSKVEARALMEAAGVPVLPGATVTEGSDLAAVARPSGFPLAGQGRLRRRRTAACGWCAPRTGWPTRWRARGREAASAFGDGTVFLERSSSTRATSRCRSSATRPARWCTCSSASARSSGATRRSWRSARRRRGRRPAREAGRRRRRGGQGDRLHRCGHRWSSCSTARAASPSWRSTPGCRSSTRSPSWSPGSTWSSCSCGWPRASRCRRRSPGPGIGGHAIEARLYAEDVPAGFRPATGTLHRFRVPELPGVRVDAGVADGSVVGPHYDPMLAKVIAHGRTRGEAARTLARALARAEIHGVTTNRDLLVGVLREPDFLAGRTDTGYLARHDPAALGAAPGGAVHAAAAALAAQAGNRAAARVLAGMPSGWRNVGGTPQRVAYALGERTVEVTYAFRRSGPDVAWTASRWPCGCCGPPRTASSWRSTACGGPMPCTGWPGGRSWTARTARSRWPRCRASPTRTPSRTPVRCWPRCPAAWCGYWWPRGTGSPRGNRWWCWRP
jgi:hypothetical protein